jgi:hypothetical protein
MKLELNYSDQFSSFIKVQRNSIGAFLFQDALSGILPWFLSRSFYFIMPLI